MIEEYIFTKAVFILTYIHTRILAPCAVVWHRHQSGFHLISSFRTAAPIKHRAQLFDTILYFYFLLKRNFGAELIPGDWADRVHDFVLIRNFSPILKQKAIFFELELITTWPQNFRNKLFVTWSVIHRRCTDVFGRWGDESVWIVDSTEPLVTLCECRACIFGWSQRPVAGGMTE